MILPVASPHDVDLEPLQTFLQFNTAGRVCVANYALSDPSFHPHDWSKQI